MDYVARMQKNTPEIFRYLTTDLLIVDRIALLAENPRLQRLIDKYNLKPDGKAQIENRQDFLEFMNEYASCINVKEMAGGSALNMGRTIAMLGGKRVDVRFVGVLGNDPYSQIIRKSCEETGVTLIGELPQSKKHLTPEPAISFVIVFPNGRRTIITWPGNAKEIITPELYPVEEIHAADIISLQGSTRKKFNEDVLDHIMSNRWVKKNDLVLAAPTSAFQPDYFKWAITSVDDFASNTDELGFIFKVDVKNAKEGMAHQLAAHEALFKLKSQQETEYHVLANAHKPLQVAFITDGEHGGYVVDARAAHHVEAHKVKVVNTLGAGDCSFACYTFAKKILGVDALTAAKFAMAMAAMKVQAEGPILTNPRAALPGALEMMEPSAARLIREALKGMERGSEAVVAR